MISENRYTHFARVNRNLWIILLVTCWFGSSSLAVLTTKALFSGAALRLPRFPFGLTLTATNNVVASLLAAIVSDGTRDHDVNSNVVQIASVIGAATAVEIGLSNIALNLLTVSFSTVLKGMAPFFVLGWGLALKMHSLHFGTVLSLLAMVVGLSLVVAGQGEDASPVPSRFFQAGLLAQMLSAVFSGFRWMLTQIFIKGEPILNERIKALLMLRPLSRGLSAVETVKLVSPFTCFWVLPFALFLEGTSVFAWVHGASFEEGVKLLVVLITIGVSVYVLLWSEYELVRLTSSLTVSAGFVLKEVLTVFAGGVIFRDRLSFLTYAGFIIVQGGVLVYGVQRHKTLEERIPTELTSDDNRV